MSIKDLFIFDNRQINLPDLADILLNKLLLNINDHKYRLVEIEFYLTTDDHPDPFTHCDPEQKQPANWYFHRQNGGSYKGGTFKGLDITFGYKDQNNDKKSYGGILIRSIMDDETKDIIEGSCKVVDTILKLCKYKSIQDLSDKTKLSLDKQTDNLLYLESSENRKTKIYSGPRVGLTLKNPSDLKEEYIMKNYRFTTHPSSIKKSVHGMIVQIAESNQFITQTCKIMNITESKVKKILSYVEDGKNTDLSKYHHKDLTTEEWCNLLGAWKNKYENTTTTTTTTITNTVVNVKKDKLKKSLEEWLKDKNNIYIGRDMSRFVKGATASKWQNPFSVGEYGRNGCLTKYKEYILNNKELLNSLDELKDKNLGCWCAPEKCHGDILVELLKEKQQKPQKSQK